MAGLLGASGAITGGLVGLVAGAAWGGIGLGRMGPPVAAAVTGLALLADLARIRPPAVGKQVPQAWGQVFGTRLTAVLYGARLGVGPLTILWTWTWWAAFVVSATLGPWPSAAVGAAFALSRTLATLLAGGGATTGVLMRDRMGALTTAEPMVVRATAAILAVAAVSTALA